MEDEQKPSGFIVKDRRRFDSQGNEVEQDEKRSSAAEARTSQEAKPKLEAAPKNPPPKQEQTQARTQEQRARPSAQSNSSGIVSLDEDERDEGVNFASFVMSLATQALMLLGEIEAPPGSYLKIDREAAKQTIDILSMLREKTRGNLAQDEDFLIEEILHNLRMSFVRGTS